VRTRTWYRSLTLQVLYDLKRSGIYNNDFFANQELESKPRGKPAAKTQNSSMTEAERQTSEQYHGSRATFAFGRLRSIVGRGILSS
jgi:hypothetical protein